MNIKIEFKGKVHKLAPSLKSLDDIHNDVKLRYPNCFKNGMVLGFLADGVVNTLTTFEQLQQLTAKAAGASVKLRVYEGKELPQNIADVNSSQYAWRKESKDETGVFEVALMDEPKKVDEPFFLPEISVIEHKVEEPLQKEPQKVDVPIISVPAVEVKVEAPKPVVEEKPEPKVEIIEIPAAIAPEAGKFYACYQCRGKPALIACAICQGKGKISEGHPLVAFLDELLNDRLQVLLQRHLNIKPIEKAPEPKLEVPKPMPIVEQTGPSYGRKSMNDYSFAFSHPPQGTVKSGFCQEFLWSLNIVNNGSISWPRRIYVYRIRNGGLPDQIYEIHGVMPGQQADLTIGFRASRKNAVELFDLRIGYVDLYEGVVFFGPKFGFQLDTREEAPVEKLRDNDEIIRDKIQTASKLVKYQRHTHNYILSQLRRLGITNDVTVEMLVDIIASLQ